MVDAKMYELMNLQRKEGDCRLLLNCNSKTEAFGLALSEKEAELIVSSKNDSLKKYQRLELGEGILPKLVFIFCDSRYLQQENYVESLIRLQDIFFRFKNETADLLTDRELLNFMYEQFEQICMGDMDYLEHTCLERLAEAVRAGHVNYRESEGKGLYEALSEEERWDSELYLETLRELCWR